MEDSPITEQPEEMKQEQPQEVEENPIGCSHYARKLKFVTPCCDKIYTCRFCHDAEENHSVNRKEITEVVCALCNTRQPVRAECQQCATTFGNYTCLECNLFDDDTSKGQFHCNGCGICRVGGADKFFHCETCNLCLPIKRQNDHKCVENVSRADCPVCLEDLHTSRISAHVPQCGHLLHITCYKDLLRSGHYTCPICQTTLEDMSTHWQILDLEIANTPMPLEYYNVKVDILCKDCHVESSIPFHVLGLKCVPCGSYNTCRSNRLNGDGVPLDNDRNDDLGENSDVVNVEADDGEAAVIENNSNLHAGDNSNDDVLM